MTPHISADAMSGGMLASVARARALGLVGDVTILDCDAVSERSLENIPVIAFKKRTSGAADRCQYSIRPLSHEFSYAERREFKDILNASAPDIVVIDRMNLRDLAKEAIAEGYVTIASMHNVESEKHISTVREQAAFPGSLRWVQGRIGVFFAPREERKYVTSVPHIWACSDRDAEMFRDMGAEDVTVMTNPIPDENVFDFPITPERYAGLNAVYVGSLQYDPNVLAVETLLSTIWPELSNYWKLVIAGRKPAPALVRRVAKTERVELLDSPEEVAPLLASAGYSIMPIRSGGGTRLKVLEAMAAGVVVIATEKAVEGLGLVDGEHYLRAETTEEFKTVCEAAGSDPAAMCDLANRARVFVRTRYGSEHIAEAVRAAIAKL